MPSFAERRSKRVISSVGRASALQAECRRFDSVITHHFFGYLIRQIFCAVVAQLVRVPACHAGGRGFEPRPPRQNLNRAQWVRFFCVWQTRQGAWFTHAPYILRQHAKGSLKTLLWFSGCLLMCVCFGFFVFCIMRVMRLRKLQAVVLPMRPLCWQRFCRL